MVDMLAYWNEKRYIIECRKALWELFDYKACTIIFINQQNGHAYSVEKHIDEYPKEGHLYEGWLVLPRGFGITTDCIESMQDFSMQRFKPPPKYYVEIDNMFHFDKLKEVVYIPVKQTFYKTQICVI